MQTASRFASHAPSSPQATRSAAGTTRRSSPTGSRPRLADPSARRSPGGSPRRRMGPPEVRGGPVRGERPRVGGAGRKLVSRAPRRDRGPRKGLGAGPFPSLFSIAQGNKWYVGFRRICVLSYCHLMQPFGLFFLILKFYFQPLSLPCTLVCCTSSLDCIVSILDLTCKINHLISITDLLSTSYKPGTAEG